MTVNGKQRAIQRAGDTIIRFEQISDGLQKIVTFDPGVYL
jgi:hypothetical protein